jgi:hypothetical protein
MPAPAPQLYDSTDTTLQTVPISTGTIAAGTSFGPTTYHFWNDKGGSIGADTINDAFLIAQMFNGTDWVTSGPAALDEGWIKARLSGVVNPGNDPAFATQSSGYMPISSFHPLSLDPIPKNCARIIDVKIDVPAGSADVSQNVRLALLYNERVIPLGLLTSLASGGAIIPERWTSSIRRLNAIAGGATGAAVIVTGSGLATVSVAARWYNYDGLPYLATPQTVTLNQTDGAAAALTVGTSYIATLSQAVGVNTVTTTKGTKAASPTKPAVPANEILLGYVTVAYQGGGTSIINQGNIDTSAVVFGEFFLTAGSGLSVTVGPGAAITTADMEIRSTVSSSIAVADNTARAIWMLSDGTLTTAAIGATSPAIDAIYFGQVGTSGGAIVQVLNDNLSIGRAIDTYTMFLRYKGPLTVGTNLDWDTLPWGYGSLSSTPPEWYLERIFADTGTVPSGVGSTIIDINYRGRAVPLTSAGTTIFTSQGAGYDRRISLFATAIAGDFDGVNSIGASGHEVRTFSGGTRFSFDVDAVSSVAPTDVVIQLQFRRLR